MRGFKFFIDRDIRYPVFIGVNRFLAGSGKISPFRPGEINKNPSGKQFKNS
jgi:hypothetical protein